MKETPWKFYTPGMNSKTDDLKPVADAAREYVVIPVIHPWPLRTPSAPAESTNEQHPCRLLLLPNGTYYTKLACQRRTENSTRQFVKEPMNTRLFWGIFLFSGFIAGCAMNPTVDTLTGEQKAKLDTMKIFHTEAKRPYKVIESVTARSCQTGLFDSRIDSEEEAIEGLKLKALLLNADAVVNTSCCNSALGLLSTCWSLIECSGDAVKFIDK